MRNKLGPGTTLSYCTNVHPTVDLHSLVDQLQKHATEVKDLASPDEPLGVGVWMPGEPNNDRQMFRQWVAEGVDFLLDRPHRPVRELGEWMRSAGIEAVTANAFPYRIFHGEVVKHRVYEPDWSSKHRVAYSVGIAELLACITPMQESRSVSTLPLGWSRGVGRDEAITREAAERLRDAAVELSDLGLWRRAPFTLDLEPEPGCILDTASDVIAFFDKHLPDEIHRKHIGICHDVCHAAVMFEDQREVIRRYAEAGIRVNKVQISSALDVDVRTIGVDAAIEHLTQFAEPRYLHQTGFMTDGQFELIEDLPEAIERLEAGPSAGPIPDRLRVHFHVPVYLDHIGPLGTTNDQIAEAVAAAREYHDTKHFEVETYAWGVLPEELKRDTLAEGIADELKWVLKTCGQSDS